MSFMWRKRVSAMTAPLVEAMERLRLLEQQLAVDSLRGIRFSSETARKYATDLRTIINALKPDEEKVERELRELRNWALDELTLLKRLKQETPESMAEAGVWNALLIRLKARASLYMSRVESEE